MALRNQGRRTSSSRIEPLERRQMLASATEPVIHPLQLGAAAFVSGNATAAGDLYAGMADMGASEAAQAVAVTEVTPFTLNWFPMKAALAAAPLEFATNAASSAIALPLPSPDGSISWFNVVESPIMEEGLAKKFPGIQTFRGVGIDDPTASVRLDFTPAGFHAQVISPGGTFYIDPYYRNDLNGTYASYYKSDMLVDEAWHCDIHADDALTAESEAAAAASLTFGNDLRTYRAAVAATGEYTAFHGGTVALGQAAIVTSMNRVNQVYETELSIRMVLVANNSSVVYTNAGSDPFSNSNPSSLLAQNITNMNTVIGNSNFDIGHVFSTAGGGLAYLGVVGRTNKAGGETGTSSPINDAFDIDYVAHEMGHQFGANHTFNTSNDTGNRNGPTAYEPGSGSTIMAYAGLEGAEDLQPNSDPYFHSESIEEIRDYVTDTIPSVGTLTSTGNTAPTVNAGLDYTIPTNTPFILTATGSDPNGDVVTYEWQERDLGVAVLLNSPDNGFSPLFRDWIPSTTPSRVLPKLTSVLANNGNVTNNTSGRPVEKLFNVTRTSNWRVIARDNKPGGGGVTTDDMVLNVVSTGSAFAVTAPNTAVSWTGGTAQTVTWNVASTTGSGINAANVNIFLSIDGGNTYPYTLASATANDGSQSITVPAGVGSTQARVKIQPTNNIFFDVSNVNFTVINGTPQPGTISGQLYEDRNADGIQNGNDVPKNGVVVYLDTNNDGDLDGGESSTTTSGSGNYSFASLTAGTYHLREQIPSGYIGTNPTSGAIDVVVNSGATTTQNLFVFPTTYTGTAAGDTYTLRKTGVAPTPFYLDNFDRAALNGGPHTYTTTVTAGDGGAGIFGNLLLITNDASATIQASGATYVTTPTSAYLGFNQQLHSNTAPMTWTFNMQQLRPNPAGFGSSNYGVAYVLGATSSTITTANGYAVILGNASSPDPIKLVRFTGGLNGTVVVIAQDAAQDAINNYWSIKVNYNPTGDQWSLYTRNDGASSFADPASGAGYVQSGSTASDSTYVNTPLTHSAAFWNYSSGGNQVARFDNFKLMLDAQPPKVEVLVNSVPTYSALPSQVPSMSFNLGDGDDTLIIDESNGTPIQAGGVLFDGGNDNDTLTLTGTSAADSITVNGLSVSFGGGIGVTNAESLVANTGGGADSMSVLTPFAAAITFNGGLAIGEIDTLNLMAGPHVFNADANAGTANLVLNVSSGASATFNATQHLESLILSGGATVSMQQNGSRMIVTDTLAITGVGTALDLADNDMIVRSGNLGSWTGSTYDGITGLIRSGTLLTSLPTSGVSNTRLAIASAAELYNLSGGATDTFDSETVSAGDVLVKYTYVGDADLDGDLDGDDYFRIDANVLQSGATFGYYNGDLNLDGEINGDDYFAIDSEILSQGPPL